MRVGIRPAKKRGVNSKSHLKRSKRRSSSPIRLGFVALSDCAPLLVADELGFYEKHSVTVELHREVGWATIREKILYRQLDASHAVVGLALSLRLGLYGMNCPAITPFVMSLNGNAITLSKDLWDRGVREVRSLGKLIRSGHRLLTFGIVAQTSSHYFLLRRWLKEGGIDPDHDVRTVVLPPTQMASTLAMGVIDGYCAGEPWNSLAVNQGAGWCPALSEDIMPNHPDKVLITTEDYEEAHGEELRGLIRALSEASMFCDEPKNREKVVQILHARSRMRVSLEVLRKALTGPFDDGSRCQRPIDSFMMFHKGNANEPSDLKRDWLVERFIENELGKNESRLRDEAKLCYRPDLYQEALQSH